MESGLSSWTWSDLEKIFDITPPKNVKYSSSQLNEVEQVMHIKFPPSYRYYAQNWGCGVVSNMFVVYTPIKNPNLNIQTRYSQLLPRILHHIERGRWKETDLKILNQMCPFGKSDNGDILGWNRTKVFTNGEMPIYILDSDFERLAHVGDSLLSFFGDFCVNGKLDDVFPIGNGQKWNLQPTFEAYE